jgi:hypothetical protein
MKVSEQIRTAGREESKKELQEQFVEPVEKALKTPEGHEIKVYVGKAGMPAAVVLIKGTDQSFHGPPAKYDFAITVEYMGGWLVRLSSYTSGPKFRGKKRQKSLAPIAKHVINWFAKNIK